MLVTPVAIPARRIDMARTINRPPGLKGVARGIRRGVLRRCAGPIGRQRKVGSHAGVIRGRIGRNQHLTIPITVFFLWARRRSIRGIFGQQLATHTIDLPRFRVADDSLNAVAIAVVGVTIRRSIVRGSHAVLGIVRARAVLGVEILGLITCRTLFL